MDLETCYQNSRGDNVCITKQLCSCNHEQLCSCDRKQVCSCDRKQVCPCNHEQFCSCSKHKYLPKTYRDNNKHSAKKYMKHSANDNDKPRTNSQDIKENISLNDILEDIYAKSAANVSNPFDLLKKLNKKDKFEMSLGEQREQFKTSLSMKLDNEISYAIPQKIRGKKN